MKKLILILIFTNLIFSEDSFLTAYEYGGMLYENPRGIGCNRCHGDRGEGMSIAKYRDKKKDKELSAPQINNLSYNLFSLAFNKIKKSDIMPKYFLTRKEIQTLFLYLKEKNLRESSK